MVSSLRSFACRASLLALGGYVGLSAGCSGTNDAGPTGGAGNGNGGGSAAGMPSAGNSAAGQPTTAGTGGGGAAGAPSGGTNATAGAAGETAGSGGAAAGSGGSAGSAPDVSAEGDGNSDVGPTYTKDPDLTDQGKTKGKKFSLTMHSADSKVFKGDDATLSKPPRAGKENGFDRNITVYIPALYKDGTDAPVLIIQDGPGPIDSISRALDNLTVSTDPLKKLPPFVAVAVQNGSDRDGADGQGSERGLEYDTMSDRYSRFIDTEVLPAVIADAKVKEAYPGLKFTKDPQGRGSFGCSSGGAAALSMGWFVPSLWHRIITYSGTFVDQQNHTQPEAMMMSLRYGAWEYHSDQELIKNADNKPLRIFLNANESDLGKGRPEEEHHDWIVANQRTAEDLAAKKYHYKYIFGKGVGHCAGEVQNATIAVALSWAWRGYQAPQ
jgi:iron(III)-enterobactin esterase